MVFSNHKHNDFTPFSKPTAMLRGHNAPIFYLFIANDENRIFSLSTDKCIKVMYDRSVI